MSTLTLVLILSSIVASAVNALAASLPPTTAWGKVLHVIAAMLPGDVQRAVSVLQTPPAPAKPSNL